eukprot:gene19070-20985_t
MSHTDPKSLANLYQPLDEVALGFARTVYEVATSRLFLLSDFQNRDIFLSEAYLLLWQNSETGHVDGRKVGLPLKVGAYAALFLDLIVAGKLEIFLSPEDRDPRVRVVDDMPTGTFLDDGLFDSLRARHHRTINLQKWLEKAEESSCVDIILNNLILRGILKKEKCGMLGLKLFRKFPTTNPQPERDLVQEIRDVAITDTRPDSYILALLALCRDADNIFLISDPILKKHFEPDEYQESKKKIDKLIVDSLKKGRPRSWYRPRSRNLTISHSIYSPGASPRPSPRMVTRSNSMHGKLQKTKSA